MKTLLIGNFGDRNLGDELLLAAALREYKDVVVMTNDPSFSQYFTEMPFRCVPFFPTGFRSLLKYLFSSGYRRAFREQIQGVEQVVFVGGGLFAIRLKAYIIWGLMFWWAKRLMPKAEIRFEHQGVDAPSFLLSKKIVQSVLMKADFVSVRDEASQKVVELLIGDTVEVVGDRALKIVPSKCQIRDQKILLLNARASIPWGPVWGSLEHRFPDTKFQKIFVGFHASDMMYAPEDAEVIKVFPKTKTELFSLFETATYAVGERFHFVLLGDSFVGHTHTFTLRKPYADKVYDLCKTKNIEPLDREL